MRGPKFFFHQPIIKNMELETQKALAAFLDSKDRDKFIVDWLVEDNDVPKWKARGIVKLVLAPLMSLTGKVAGRGIEKTHEALKNRFSDYDEVSTRFSRLLLIKLECDRTKKKYSEEYLNPPEGEDAESWKKLNEQTQVWIKQLQELELTNLTLGDMQAKVRLHIDTPRLDKTKAPSRWLRPYNAFIPLIGRDNEKEILSYWLNEEKGFSWKIIIGEGGIGKTRLAQEFARACIETEWDGGFLDHEHLDSMVSHDQFVNWMPLTDTLIIVDYAVTKQESLKKLLHQCARISRNEEAAKLRLLFLERHADQNQGWVEELQKEGEGALKDEICDALHPVVELKPPLQQDDHEMMVSLLKETLKSWEKLTGESAPELPELSEEDFYELRSNTEGRPLYLQMAALHACDKRSAVEIARWNRAALLQDAVKRERDYIGKHCSSSPQKLVERLATLLYFAGKTPCNHPDLMPMIEAEAKACGYPHNQPGESVEALIQLFRDDEDEGMAVYLDPIQPDLIGAAFSATILQEQGNHKETLDRTIQLGSGAAWANLLRSAQDLYGVGTFELEIWLSSLLYERSKEELWSIANLLPEQSVALRSFAVNLYEVLLQRPENDEEKANSLVFLSNSYSEMGRREEALDAALRAIKIYEHLVKKNPDAFEPNLAGSFNNLGIRHSDLGQKEDALEASLRAIEIQERLAKKNPDAFNPDLAMSLNNFGSCYSGLGRREEALEAGLRASEIYERLAKKNPDAFDPDLAMSLNNLGNRYRDLGRREDALEVTLGAIEIYERLAKKNPDAFDPEVARSLNNLGIRHSDLSQKEDALEASLRASEIHERLAKKNRDVFEPDLAATLSNLGKFYSDLDRREEALVAGLRASEFYERLAKKNPDAFDPALAMSLNNLGSYYSDLGRKEEGLDTALRSVEIRDRLAKKKPDAFNPDLAMSLNNLGSRYRELGRRVEALEVALLAVKIYERLAKKNPDAFDPNLAKSFGTLGSIYRENQDLEQSRSTFENGVQRLNRLFKSSPKAFVGLMKSLSVDYLKSCEELDVVPDMELLGPIQQKLQELEEE
jgi:tetratricopeptide (TPR) repeat protein